MEGIGPAVGPILRMLIGPRRAVAGVHSLGVEYRNRRVLRVLRRTAPGPYGKGVAGSESVHGGTGFGSAAEADGVAVPAAGTSGSVSEHAASDTAATGTHNVLRMFVLRIIVPRVYKFRPGECVRRRSAEKPSSAFGPGRGTFNPARWSSRLSRRAKPGQTERREGYAPGTTLISPFSMSSSPPLPHSESTSISSNWMGFKPNVEPEIVSL